MGRYIRGNNGFSYKYVYARQPSNLGGLAEWSGVGSGGFDGGLIGQFFLPAGAAPDDELVDGVGPLTCVYQRRWAAADVLGGLGVAAPADLELLIYAIAENWQAVLHEVERRMPMPPASPIGIHLDAGARWSLDRAEWGALAARLGHGVDPEKPATCGPASDALWESGAHELLPFLALQALGHAVKHDLERLELVDADPVSTNLWEVTKEMAGRPGTERSDRAMHARLLHYLGQREESAALWRTLLAEDSSDLLPAHYLFSHAVTDGRWDAIETMAEPLLGLNRPDAERGRLLSWRGEARWSRGDLAGAAEDGAAAAGLGDPHLQSALEESRRREKR